MKKLKQVCFGFAAMLVTILWMTTANAAFEKCKNIFYNDSPPTITNPSLSQKSFDLCYSQFAVLYSGVSKTPIYSAEKLTKQNILDGQAFKRSNNFHEEQGIPDQYRASVSEYYASGYDKGHAAPYADFGTATAQYESFTLTNVMPQSPKNNQQAWRLLEESVRKNVLSTGEDAYIFTGAAYLDHSVKKVGSILVPDHIYKVVFYPEKNIKEAYLIENKDDAALQKLNISALESKVHISFY